jgi:hypothetical protein
VGASGAWICRSNIKQALDAAFSSDMEDTNDTYIWGIANGQSFIVSGSPLLSVV